MIDRPVWRIRNGRATRVVYEIWRGPGGETADIDGVPRRSEFGIEIHVAVAFLVSMVGLSIDNVCAQLRFFWQLELSKSQADSLLNQLAQQWADEFEALCQLLAVSAVVHADETSWSRNPVWAFLSEKARVLVFGCRKDSDTLAQILSKDDFNGVLVSDDAAVYRGFSNAQKCWVHCFAKPFDSHCSTRTIPNTDCFLRTARRVSQSQTLRRRRAVRQVRSKGSCGRTV